MTQHSPWWYRQRGLVLTAVYVVAFFGGSLLWSLGGREDESLAAWAGARLGGFGPGLVLALGSLLAITAWAIRVWGASYLSARVVWNPDARTNALLVDGPFRYLRNPLYLGSALLALGIGTLASPYGFAILVIGHAIFLPMLIRYEERGLRQRYGAAYEAYARAVPAFIPRLTSAHVSGSVTAAPSLAQGLRAEILTAALAAGMLEVWFAGRYGGKIFIALWFGGWFAQRLVAPPLSESA
ncbi:MAG TPA: isoprenylcysteine carboxylmethyltransferase family protein [Candidatus Acidoferrum sp.]|nr:isoprenylcysteine carboxylmethyltransferase family protein [Candidatus Acidoferrum sp.]